MAKRNTPAPVKTLTGKPAGTLVHVDPRTLVMNKQVRTESDAKADDGLFESVKVNGVQSPIQARKVGTELHVIAGHRRTAAAIRAELATIPVYVTDTADDDIRVNQLTENIQRLDMSLSDVSSAVWEIYTTSALGSAKQVAAILGKPKSWVSKMLTIGDPGMNENNTVVRGLLANDAIPDLEMAYMLCRVEKLDKAVAQEIGKNIENETRATIKAKLKALTKAHPEAGDDDEPPEGQHEAPELDSAEAVEIWTFVQRIVTEATVKPADMSTKAKALAVIAKMIPAA